MDGWALRLFVTAGATAGIRTWWRVWRGRGSLTLCGVVAAWVHLQPDCAHSQAGRHRGSPLLPGAGAGGGRGAATAATGAGGGAQTGVLHFAARGGTPTGRSCQLQEPGCQPRGLHADLLPPTLARRCDLRAAGPRQARALSHQPALQIAGDANNEWSAHWWG